MRDPVWTGAAEPDIARPDALGWLRVVLRGGLAIALIAVGFVVLWLVRLIERPFAGLRRPASPWITVFVCRGVLWCIGLRTAVHGRPMSGRVALVANHASWLDIFALNAQAPVCFVSKSEVAGWPGIGWLARITGTVFIDRDRKQARTQTELFEARLLAGHRLLFFPEGTSTDGLRVLPFKTTLFAAFLSDHLRSRLTLQPVSVSFHAPPGEVASFYGWWGSTGFGAHALRVLAAPRQGRVQLLYHPPLIVADFHHRKALAAACEAAVRDGHRRLQAGTDSRLH